MHEQWGASEPADLDAMGARINQVREVHTGASKSKTVRPKTSSYVAVCCCFVFTRIGAIAGIGAPRHTKAYASA